MMGVEAGTGDCSGLLILAGFSAVAPDGRAGLRRAGTGKALRP